jgi:uncharacterized membrane protein
VAFFQDKDRGRSRLRLIAMAIVGVVLGVAIGATTSWWYAPVAGWVSASLTYVVWVWLVIGRLDSSQTKEHSTREDPGSAISEFLILAASLASLVAVGVLLLRGGADHAGVRAVVAGLAFASVALSWTLVHTLYTLRYARVYYGEPVGGIDFNTRSESPRYVDFAYLSFTLGMTFQVSDTNLQTSQLRSIVLRHTLLSYVFGSVVLASVVNLVAGLVA